MSVPIKILVFGKNGQVGANLLNILTCKPQMEVFGADIDEVDLANIPLIDNYIREISPDWVINASAHTAVDRAESEQTLSFLLNADAPAAMAQCCAAIKTRFVHYSTDYVFDGNANRPYTESDPTNPQSVYGQSKLEGERRVLDNLADALIFRTAWMYAKKGNNFVNTMLRLSQERLDINVVNDQYGNPTFADDLAEITVNVIEGIRSETNPYVGGIFHATGQGSTNWYDFCKLIMEMTGNERVNIHPISTAEYPTEAPRPKYSVLSNQKLYDVYQQAMPPWQESLRRCLLEIDQP